MKAKQAAILIIIVFSVITVIPMLLLFLNAFVVDWDESLIGRLVEELKP